jgi:Outer membrane protein beta-barrel domain
VYGGFLKFGPHRGLRDFAAGLVALSFTLSAFATAARAQIPFHVSIAGGWTIPVTPKTFTDLWSGNGAFAAGISWRASSRLAPWLEIGYYRHAFNNDAFETSIQDLFPNVNASGNDLQVVPVTVGTDIALTAWGNTRPYVAVGFGYYSLSVTTPQTSGPGADSVSLPDPSDDVFGARLGLGVRTLVTPAVTLFFDATYHIAWTSPDAFGFVPVRVGLRF